MFQGPASGGAASKSTSPRRRTSPIGAIPLRVEDSPSISQISSSARRAPRTGRRFNGNIFGLSFGLKNGLRFEFDSEKCLNYPFYEHFETLKYYLQ